MGKRQRDCIVCGAPVGILDREHCCRCMAKIRLSVTQATCPRCGLERVLLEATGECVRCSRRCDQCDRPVRARDATTCRPCLRRAEREAAKAPCPRCGKTGLIRVDSGWCGTCSRPAPLKGPPRICRVCGELRRHSGLGMCSRCFQRDPDRPLVRAEHLIAELSDPPEWLQGFVVFLAARLARAAPRR